MSTPMPQPPTQAASVAESVASTPSGDPPPTTSTPIPQPLTQAASVAQSVASDADSQDFDRVQWAKCQARAERYEEEVQLTVEEMGRTLRYFEWKRDWWLSLKECDSSKYSPDIRGGLCAYACRQSHLYDELTTMFVVHWRTYLSARSLGSSWLDKYTSRTDPIPVRPPRRRQNSDADLDIIAVDAPLDSGSEDDSRGDENGADSERDMEGCTDAEEMFADE